MTRRTPLRPRFRNQDHAHRTSPPRQLHLRAVLEPPYSHCVMRLLSSTTALLLLTPVLTGAAAESSANSDNSLVPFSPDAAISDRGSIGALELVPAGRDTHLDLNDRGNVRLAQNDFRGAIIDYTRALEI